MFPDYIFDLVSVRAYLTFGHYFTDSRCKYFSKNMAVFFVHSVFICTTEEEVHEKVEFPTTLLNS